MPASPEEEIAADVKKHGWSAANVRDHEPPFLYSIGLMHTVKHPELIVFGLEPGVAHGLISHLVGEIRAGSRFDDAGVSTFDLRGKTIAVGLRRVHPTQHPLYLGYAMGYCREVMLPGLDAVQVFWPDRNGKFPFDPGCELAVYQRQPRLDISLTPTEMRQWERQWE